MATREDNASVTAFIAAPAAGLRAAVEAQDAAPGVVREVDGAGLLAAAAGLRAPHDRS